MTTYGTAHLLQSFVLFSFYVVNFEVVSDNQPGILNINVFLFNH